MATFLLASDSFKGTISSARAASLLADEARVFFPGCSCVETCVADGGEGTVDAVVAATGGGVRHVVVSNPLGDSVDAAYGLLPDGRAIIEMAAASGLTLVKAEGRNPWLTSTYGTGQLIADAVDQGCRDISLAIGGSATNDCGMGAMRALGARFLDAQGRELTGRGADLGAVSSIDLRGFDARLAQMTFHVMCDVDNPLLGPLGATNVFGPQKGASPEIVSKLEDGMSSFSRALAVTFGRDVSEMAGAGAAGGLGAAANLFLHAEMAPGVERVLDLISFDSLLEGVDLCITGEGHADAQTAHGKAVSGIAARCRAHGVPCVALVGGMDADATELIGPTVNTIVPCALGTESLEEALDNAERNYRFAAQRLFSILSLGARMRSDEQ